MNRFGCTSVTVRASLALLIAAGVLIASGCGTSAWGENFDHRLKQLGVSSKFSVLREPTSDLTINIRVPQAFNHAFTALSADPEATDRRIPWTRFAPPFLPDFPGLKRTFEGVDGNDQSKFYLYVGEATKASVHGKFPFDFWQKKVRSFDRSAKWESASVQTPTDSRLPWMEMTVHLRLPPPPSDPDADKGPKPYIFQMWVYEGPQSFLVLGWSAAKKTWDGQNTLSLLTAGSIDVGPGGAPAPAK
jgi:hypothetical protein